MFDAVTPDTGKCTHGDVVQQHMQALTEPLLQTVNTFLITARTCTRALVAHDRQQHPGIWSWLRGLMTRWSVEWRIALLQLAAGYQSWFAGA